MLRGTRWPGDGRLGKHCIAIRDGELAPEQLDPHGGLPRERIRPLWKGRPFALDGDDPVVALALLGPIGWGRGMSVFSTIREGASPSRPNTTSLRLRAGGFKSGNAGSVQSVHAQWVDRYLVGGDQRPGC